MYAQIRKYHSLRGGRTAAQACEDIERTALVRFAQIPGFVEYLVLELNDGGLLTLSVYEDRVGVEAGKKVSADWNKTESADSLPETPDETFEGHVRIHHRAIKKEAAV
jgi:hypothetical protein